VAGQFTSTDPLGSPAVSMMRPAPDRTPASVEAPLGTLEPDSATAAKRDSTEANAHVDASHSTASTNRTSARPASPRDGLNLYVYVKGNPESFTDPTGMFTVGLCVSAGGGAGIGGFVQACAVVGWSSDAGVSGGLTLTGGAHAYAGIGGGVAVGIQGSTASRVDDLGGPFTYLGAGGNLPPPLPIGVDGDIFTGRDGRGRPIFGGDGQLSAGGGYHVFGGESGTQVITFHDPTYSDGGRYARQLQQYVHQQVQSWIRQFLGWPRVP
jgi:hypothetical protein